MRSIPVCVKPYFGQRFDQPNPVEVYRSQGEALAPLFNALVPQNSLNEHGVAGNFMRGSVIYVQVTVNDQGLIELYTEEK